MTASVYRGEIRNLPVGADLLPYLIFEGEYIECVKYSRNLPRSETVIYLYPPQYATEGDCYGNPLAD